LEAGYPIMSVSDFTLSPPGRLVLFMTAPAVPETLVALAGYFMADLPVQQAAAITAPMNC